MTLRQKFRLWRARRRALFVFTLTDRSVLVFDAPVGDPGEHLEYLFEDLQRLFGISILVLQDGLAVAGVIEKPA